MNFHFSVSLPGFKVPQCSHFNLFGIFLDNDFMAAQNLVSKSKELTYTCAVDAKRKQWEQIKK